MVEHRHVEWDAATRRIRTSRLVLRPWRLDDDLAAHAIYGAPEVARWLSPALPPIVDGIEMRRVLAAWIAETDPTGLPLGRWAITDQGSTDVIGGVALLPLPPGGTDLEIGWQLSPKAWGYGYGAEAGHAVAHQASKTPVSVRFLRSCGRRIAVVWPPPGEWGWNGSARPTSTTTSRYRSIAWRRPT